MGYVLVSDYGVDGLRQRLKNIKWFFYIPGIHDGAHMGDDGLFSYIKTHQPLELKNTLIELWSLTQEEYSCSYKDVLAIQFAPDLKDNYLYICIQKYNHLRDHLKDDDFAIVEKLDQILDSLNPEYYPFEYIMEPIYGENFMGKDIIKLANKIKYPTEEWITYSESKRRHEKEVKEREEQERIRKEQEPWGIIEYLKELLGFDRHSS